MYCSKKEGCNGPVKPEITFFGEQLPGKFMEAKNDLADADLLIIIGTALAVAPFNMCVFEVPEDCPKVLINMTNNIEHGFEFDNAEKFPERLLLKGRSQEIVQEISEACGWKNELLDRKAKADAAHDLKNADVAPKEEESNAATGVDALAEQLGALDVNKDGDGKESTEETEAETVK